MGNDLQFWTGHSLAFLLGILSSLVAEYLLVKMSAGALRLLRLSWVARRWARFFRAIVQLRSPTTSVQELRQLRVHLRGIYTWVEERNLKILEEMNGSIWKASVLLERDILAYLALYADDVENQRDALIQLRQIDPNRVILVCQLILQLGIVSPEIRRLAQKMKEDLSSMS